MIVNLRRTRLSSSHIKAHKQLIQQLLKESNNNIVSSRRTLPATTCFNITTRKITTFINYCQDASSKNNKNNTNSNDSRRMYKPLNFFSTSSSTTTATNSNQNQNQNQNNASPTKFDMDVLIVGGGIVGSALACKISQEIGNELKIGIVETRPPMPLKMAKMKEIPDVRVYTMTHQSMNFLKSINAWDRIANNDNINNNNKEEKEKKENIIHGRAHKFDSMQVWDGSGSGFIKFQSYDYDKTLDHLGCVVENSMLQSALFERLQELEKEQKIALFCPGEAENVKFNDQVIPSDPVKVKIINTSKTEEKKKEEELNIRLLVAADGGFSKLKKIRGLPSWGWSYGQRAIVATVKLDDDIMNHTAWQRFTSTGPLALLPLWNGYSSIVWSTSPEQATYLLELDENDFLKELNGVLRGKLALTPVPTLPSFIPSFLNHAIGGVHNTVHAITSSAAITNEFEYPPEVKDICSRRFTFDLRLEQAEKYVAPRFALVGDAAHTIHPMAGQGLNLGLCDAESLSKILIKGACTGQDIGDLNYLIQYERERKNANLGMLGSLDLLHRLFGSDDGVRAWTRNMGMGTLNGIGVVKGKIAQFAMGL